MERGIRNSAKALIIRDGKILAVKLQDTDGVFYIMPGGGQEQEEPLPDAVVREVREELGICVTAEDLVFVVEGLRGESFHRVDLVFRCTYQGEDADAVHHGDTNQIGADWLDIATLNTAPLYPSKLRRAIMNLYEGKTQSVYLGEESMGDPEVTD